MGKSKELAEFRANNFGELKKTLKVLISVRDSPDTSAKDKIEASKAIGRMLSAMSPAKTGDAKPVKQVEAKPTEDEWAEIESRLAN